MAVVVRSYIDFLILLIPTSLELALFLQQHTHFFFIFKCGFLFFAYSVEQQNCRCQGMIEQLLTCCKSALNELIASNKVYDNEDPFSEFLDGIFIVIPTTTRMITVHHGVFMTKCVLCRHENKLKGMQ